jgi:hypothetical protein
MIVLRRCRIQSDVGGCWLRSREFRSHE